MLTNAVLRYSYPIYSLSYSLIVKKSFEIREKFSLFGFCFGSKYDLYARFVLEVKRHMIVSLFEGLFADIVSIS